MKQKYRIICIIIIIVSLFAFTTISYGFGIDELTGSLQYDQTMRLKRAGNTMLTAITAVGIVISVAILIILGIKYMLGSVAERAEYKKTLFPYAIGAGILFSASVIAQIIYEFAIKI